MRIKSIIAAIALIVGAVAIVLMPQATVQPGESIQAAVNAAQVGDVITVAAGTYSERVKVNKSVILEAQGEVKTQGFTITANDVTVRGFTVTATRCVWDDRGVGIWITGDRALIENNLAYYNPRSGITTRPTADYAVIRNNRMVRNGMAGAEIYGVGHLIENNEVTQSLAYHAATNCSGDADGFRFFGNGHTFRGNYIHDFDFNDPEHAGYQPHSDAFQTWKDPGQNYNMTFENNIVNLLQWQSTDSYGKGWELDALNGGVFKNNLVIAHVGAAAWGNPDVKNLDFENNTFIGWETIPCTGCWPTGVTLEAGSGHTIKNNIFLGKWYMPLELYVNVTRDGNIFWQPDGSQPDVTIKNGEQIVDPMLGTDYRPLPGSPACLSFGYIGAFDCAVVPPTDTATYTAIPPTATITHTPSATPTPTRICYPVYVGGQYVGAFCP